MTREEFDNLVHTVENGVGKNPAALRWRVAWWAMVGYVLLLFGLLLVLVGIGFKITAFPVQIWAPDVYQGSPSPTADTAALAPGDRTLPRPASS